MIRKKRHILGILIVSLLIVLSLTRCNKEEIQSQTRFLMDTYCTIQVPGGKDVIKNIAASFDRIEEIEVKFNALNPESPVYDFNVNNIPITDSEIVALVQTALEISVESDGASDITVYPLIDLWGFYTESPALPDQESLDESLKNVGYESLYIEDGKLMKHNENTKIDLGAIAKGYALGEAVEVLKQQGIESALVDAGGDIYALGTINGKPWKIGIRDPRGDGVIGSLELVDMAVVTSGDYERYFEHEGVRYHHILDPHTGSSAVGMASVTVISPDPTLADAWSTALFVMEKEKGISLIESKDSIEALIVTQDGERYYSQTMEVNTHTMKGN